MPQITIDHSGRHVPLRDEPIQLYSVGTWDIDLQAYTPQVGVPAFNLTRAKLVKSIRLLRDCGYSVHRYGNTTSGHDDNDWSVLIERTDGKSEAEIMKGWER